MAAVSSRTFPNVARGTEYAHAVSAGAIPACQWARLACERHLRDLERWPSRKTSPYYFDAKAAERVCDIVQRFPHVKGIWAKHGQKIGLQGWQTFGVMSVFGWMRSADQMRRFRTAYFEVPRKNAKSTLTSAVGLYLLACDGEHGAHVVSAANARHQAKLVLADAQHMARREGGFRAKFGVEVFAHVIAQPETGSKFEALSAEYSNLDGLNLHAALLDEVHAYSDRKLWDVLETATGSRAQPLLWAITTAGDNRASCCYEQHTHVIEILKGVTEDDTYFGMIFTVDDGDDPFEEASWKKANPNYNVSVYPESIQAEAKRAVVMPSAQPAFMTKHLNIWVNASVAWLPVGAWDKCADEALDIEDFAGKQCFIGIDLALRSDLAALVVAFPPDGAGRDWWAVFGYYYLPEETVNRGDNTHYQGWEARGRLIATPGPVTDFDYILANLADITARFAVIEIALDPCDAGPLINSIEKAGLPRPIEVRQTVTNLSPSMMELEALILSRKMKHDGDPVLAWMMSNVKAKPVGDLLKPEKDAPEKKIDGVISLLMCIGRAMRNYSPDNSATPGIWII